MAQPDFTNPMHRLDNLSKSQFFQAYARVRWHIRAHIYDDLTQAFMNGYMESLELDMANVLDIPLALLLGKLVDYGDQVCNPKAAKDEAESPTG